MQPFEEKQLTFSELRLPFSVFLNTSSTDVQSHWHNHLELLYLNKGEAFVEIDEERFAVKTGDFLIINSNECHSTSEMKNTEFLVIQFKPSLINPGLDSLFENKYFYPFLQKGLKYDKHIRIINDTDLKSLLSEIYGDFKEKSPGYELNIKGNIYKIFSRLIKNRYMVIPVNHAESSDMSKLAELLLYVKNNYYEKITDDIAAKMSFMSYHHFCRVFKRVTGKTFVEYLNYVRLCEAEKQLAYCDKSISEIAVGVGFSSTSYFTRLFTGEKGISPSAYRKQNCAKTKHN